MTETETWILNEFANDVARATETGDQGLIDECQREFDEYYREIQLRDKERAKA